jgi:hypothetical protein
MKLPLLNDYQMKLMKPGDALKSTGIWGQGCLVRLVEGPSRMSGSAWGWSVKYDWGRRARKYDEDLERQNRKTAEAKLPYWAKMRERSHRLNMKLARDIRKKIQEMLKHPITVEEVKDMNGREVVFVMPARWTYNTVGNLSKIAAELEAGTIADATMSMLEEDTFDPQAASIEELRDYIQRHSPRKGRVTE